MRSFLITAATLTSFLGSTAVAAADYPEIVHFEGEMTKAALKRGMNSCTLASYKTNDAGKVFGVRILKHEGHRSMPKKVLRALQGMKAETGKAGAYDVVVQSIVTSPSASSSVQMSDVLPAAEKACPYKAKSGQTLVISGQRLQGYTMRKCDRNDVGSNMASC